MNVCCARGMLFTTVASMKASDPDLSGVLDGQFIFSNEELFNALQEVYSLAEIQEMIDTLAPTLDENPCTCGTTDPTICGVTMIAIFDETFARPTTQ